jgi:uncharacterized protein with PQ loop repeat
MHLVTILGVIACIASSLIVVYGLPAQIKKNKKEKTVGLSPAMIYSMLIVYFFWSLYAWVKPDYFLAIPQTVGTIDSVIILLQYFHYQKLKREGIC